MAEKSRWEDRQCNKWGVLLVEGQDIRRKRKLGYIEFPEPQLTKEAALRQK
jgi:hypothetical protein